MEIKYLVVISEWIAIIIGCYLIYHILQYLHTKPMASQTLLDGIRIQLFQYMIAECVIIGVVATVNICVVKTPWIIANILGWAGKFCILLHQDTTFLPWGYP